MASILLLIAIVMLSFTFAVWLGVFLLDVTLETSRALGMERRRMRWFQIGFGGCVLATDIILIIVLYLVNQLPVMAVPV